MQAFDTPKPATALHGEPASNFELPAKQLCNQHTRGPIEHQQLQAFRLNRRFGFAFETAVVIASLAWDRTMSKYKWVWHDFHTGARFYDVGILSDGSLHNPRGY